MAQIKKNQKNLFPQPEEIVYNPDHEKNEALVDAYSKTEQFAHRFLAYRDIPRILKQHVKGNRALDYGTGTGISAAFLQSLNFKLVGVDISPLMLERARENYPLIQFLEVSRLSLKSRFDLIFSCFVLFDMKSKNNIINYLSFASKLLDETGVMIAITGSEDLYSPSRDWIAYDSKFPENINLNSGDLARLKLKDPDIEFRDYYWKEQDYLECFEQANLDLLGIHKPLGSKNDPYFWKDEVLYAPFTIFILTKKKL